MPISQLETNLLPSLRMLQDEIPRGGRIPRVVQRAPARVVPRRGVRAALQQRTRGAGRVGQRGVVQGRPAQERGSRVHAPGELFLAPLHCF